MSDGIRRPALREKAERTTGHALAIATIVGGTTSAVSHPGLEVIFTQISMVIVYTLWWSANRHHMRLLRMHQQLQRRLITRALADPENEHIRLLLVVHAATYPGR
jgi:hypothetical protein